MTHAQIDKLENAHHDAVPAEVRRQVADDIRERAVPEIGTTECTPAQTDHVARE